MTIQLSWATNANYSAGPDNGTPTKVNPASTANGFISGVIAAPQHINYLFGTLLNAELAKALDGAAGGTYSPSAPIIIASDGEMHFASTAELKLLTGSVLTHEAISGELYEDGAICLFEDVADLRVDGASYTWVSCLVPQFVVGSWSPNTVGTYIQAGVAGTEKIGFALPMLPGDTITTVTVRVHGGLGVGHSATPANPPTVELISVNNNGSVTVVATATDAVTFPTYDTAHNIVLSGAGFPFTVPTGSRVLVRVSGESGANAVADTTGVLWVDGTGVQNHFRNTTEFF